MKNHYHFTTTLLAFIISYMSFTLANAQSIMTPDTLYQVVIIGQSQAGGYAIWNDAITIDTEPNIYTLTNGPLDADNGPTSELVLLTEGDINDNNGSDPNTETSISGLLRQAKASSNCTNCHFLGSIAYRNGIPINGLVKGGYGYEFGWGQLHGDFIRGYEIAQDSGWFWQPIFVLQHGGAGGTPYGVLVNKMKDDFRLLVDSLSSGTIGYFASVQQREKSPVDFGIEMLMALDTVDNADVIMSRDNAVEKTNDEIHMTNWGQRHEGVYFGHHIGRKYIAGEILEVGLRVGDFYWDGTKLIVPILNSIGPLVGSGDHDMKVYNVTDDITIPGNWTINGANLVFTPTNTLAGTKVIRIMADRGTGILRDSRPNTTVTLPNSDGNPYVLYQYLLRYNYEQTIIFQDPLGGTQTLNSFNHTVNNGGKTDYYVYYPLDYDSDPTNRPILIALHGLGEFDGNPSVLLSSPYGKGIAELANDGLDFPLMVFSPHGRRRIGGQYSDYWNIELLKEFVDHIISTYDVDPNRIYFTGFSTGAQAVWQYAVSYPNDLAAIVPLAGRTNISNTEFGINLRNPQYACTISNIPINAFHGSSDTVIPSNETTSMVNAVNNCSPQPDPLAIMNLVNGIEHDPLRPLVYSDVSSPDNIYSWMMQYEKGGLVIDNEAPTFVASTPNATNITDISFELNISLDEIGTTYYAAYPSGFIPTIDNVINGTGNNLLFHNSISNTQNGSATVANLTPQTDYTVWFIAEDDSNPSNVQSSLTQLLVRTSYVLDTDPPLPPQSITLVPNVSSIAVNWTPGSSPDVELHEVYRIDSVWQVVDTTTPNNPMDQVTKKLNLRLENNVIDASGNGVNSNLINGTSFSSSNILEGGFSGQFDGNNDFIDLDIGNQFIHAPFNQRTISMWIYPLSTSGIQDLFDEGGSTNGIGLRINNGQLQGAIQNQHVIRTISATINENEWSHVALEFNNGQLKLFVNGLEKTSDLNVPFTTVNNHGNGGGLGGTNSSNAFDAVNDNFQGYIDDFIITENVIDSSILKGYYDFYMPVVDSTLTTNTKLLASLQVPATQFIDTQVEDSTDYTYYVIAKDTADNPSLASEFQSARLVNEVLIPEKPQEFVANLSQVDQASLQWDMVITPGFRDYTIYRSTSSFSQVNEAELIASGVITNSFIDSTLLSSTTYYYRLAAFNVLGETSELSDLASISTSDFEPPSTPPGFTGSLTGTFATLNWSDSPSADINGYRLYRNVGSNPNVATGFLYQEFDSSILEFEDQSVQESEEYYYLLTAIDTAGNESDGTNVISLTIPNLTPPSSPVNLLATFSTQSINLNWESNSEPDLGGYMLWKSTASNNWPDDFLLLADSIQETFFRDEQVSSLSNYYYALSAYDSVGNISDISEIIQVNTPDIESPQPPQNLTLASQMGSINLNWQASSSNDVEYYLIYRGLGIDPPLTLENLVDSTDFDVLTYVDSNVIEGYTYHYLVAAIDTSGNLSEGSNSESSQPQNITPPSTPTNIQLILTDDTSVLIDWEDNTDIDIAGYRIYKGLMPGFSIDSTSLLGDDLLESNYLESRLEFATTYYYSIQAFDVAGNLSEPSVPQSITTNPLPPLGPSLVSTVKINWNPNGVSSGLLEWNDLLLSVPFGYTTYNNLLDSAGNSVGYNIVIPNARDQSNINNTQDNGASFTGGVYPDEVMRYAGWTSSAGRFYLRNLNPDNTYSIELYSGRNYNSTGNTTFTIQGVSIDVQCYLNKTELVLFEDVIPNSNNEIEIAFRENNTWSKGYLNGMIIREFEPGSEAVPPETPQGLIGNLIDENQFQLQWNHVTTPGIKDYSLYRSTSSFSQIEDAELIASGIQSNSYLDSTLESSSSYFYAVVAYNIINEASGISNIISISTSDFQPPLTPISFNGNIIGTSVQIQWGLSPSPDVERYNLYRNENDAPTVSQGFLYQSFSAATIEFLDNNVEESKDYHYLLTAIDSAGNESLPTPSINFLIPDVTPPNIPTGLTASLGTEVVNLAWDTNNEPDLGGYTVWRSAISNNWPDDFSMLAANLVASAYEDADVTSDTQYFYAITAQDSVGNSSGVSNIITVTTPDIEAPETPISFNGNIIGTSVQIQWGLSPSPDVERYNLYRNENDAPTVSQGFLYQSFSAATIEFLDNNVEESKDYHYLLTAIDSAGNESLPTPSINFLIPDVTPPNIPTGLTASINDDNQIQLSWNDNTDNDLKGYNVWRAVSDFSSTNEAVLIAFDLQTSSYLDQDVENESTYFYGIIANDVANNTSNLSPVISIQTNDIIPPASPRNLTVVNSGNSLVLGWLANDDLDIFKYRVYGGTTSSNPASIQTNLIAEIDTTSFPMYSYNLGVADEGITYYFAVTGIDNDNNESILSDIVGGALPNITPPSTPSNLQLSLIDATSISVTWNNNTDSDLTGYKLYRSNILNFTYDETTLLADSLSNPRYLDENLEHETVYYYSVIAFDNANNISSPSSTKSIQTDPVPPSGPSLVSTVKVNWTQSGVDSGLAEWNDLTMNLIRGYTSYQVNDSIGNNVDYTVVVAHAQGNSNINGITDNGAGFTGGVYPDQVMRYAGWTSSAGRLYLRNLNPENTYDIELYSGRNYNSTGNTSFTVGGVTVDVQCYLNKTELVRFKDVNPNAFNEIEIVFTENNIWSKGYLNGMIIREYQPSSESSARTNTEHTAENFQEVTEISSNADFTIYPMPTDGELSIKGDFPYEKGVEVQIFDNSGSTIYKNSFTGMINESLTLNVEPGVYFFKLIGQETFITRKILVTE